MTTTARSIELSRQALKTLRAMPRNSALLIRQARRTRRGSMGAHPNVRKMIGARGYRLRVGDWRVLYDVEDGRLVVLVLAIKPRGGAYQ